MEKDKERAIDLAVSQIERQFGKGSIMKLGEAHARMAVEVIPTGSIALDIALGVGGIPRGRVTEIFGPEASGKTTLVQHVMAEAQRSGGLAALIDAEHALDPTYARNCGVQIDDLFISQPDTGEQALEIAETLVRSGALDVVAIDSVAALVPRAELEGDMGDTHVGLQARLMSQALRKLTGAISRSKTAVIFTNQLREKVGVMFGNPEVTPGGRALKFYSSVRLDVRRIESIKQGTEVTGSRARVRVFTFGEARLGQGRENAREFLRRNSELRDDIERQIRQQTLGAPVVAPVNVEEDGRVATDELDELSGELSAVSTQPSGADS